MTLISRCRRPALAILFIGVIGAALSSAASAQPVPPARLSVSTGGTQANGSSTLIETSLDGTQVLFLSSASNLVAGDTNGADDLFIRDRDTDRDGVLDEPGAVRTVRVTEGMGGEQVGSGSLDLSYTPLSDDGRFVLFTTSSWMAPDDANGRRDAYLRDRDVDGDGVFDEADATTLTQVSTGSGGLLMFDDSYALDLSADGRYVLFATSGTPPSSFAQVYRKDRLTGLTVLTSSTPDGRPADTRVTGRLSPDGQKVLLSGGFAALMPTDAALPTYPWVLRDLTANTFTPIQFPAIAPPLFSSPAEFTVWDAPIGFTADSATVYVGKTTYSGGNSRAKWGDTFEYDVAAARITRHLRGVSVQPPGRDFLDGRTLLLTPEVYLSDRAMGLFAYDRSTGRLSMLVSPDLCSAIGASVSRVLYRENCPTLTPIVLLDTRYGTPLPMPDPIRLGRLDRDGRMVIFESGAATILPAGVDTNDALDIFAVDLLSRLDRDSDGLDDRWEVAMGLDYTSGTGADGAAGDPDADGATNLEEQLAATHPRGTTRQLLAEGAQNQFFSTRLGLANPGAVAATAVVRLDGDSGTSTAINVGVPAGSKRTVFVDEVPPPSGSFAAVIESSVPLVADRTVSWDATAYGAHAERASAAPSTTWFLAEGATGAFSLFYLLQNPGDEAAVVTIRYLRPAPLPPIERTYALPPHIRLTLPVDQQDSALAWTDVSAAITATQPILVERAMYRSLPGQPFAAGHASAGVPAASTSWFLAEGSTGDFFDLFILLANPNTAAADVEVRYLLQGGAVLTKTYTVAPESRRTIYVDAEDFPGMGKALAHVDVSAALTVTNGVPIVVERSMWFPGPAVTAAFWSEAHNSPGATTTATRWVLADGEAGGTRSVQTFVLIANTSATPARIRVTVLPERATPSARPQLEMVLDLPANSRTTVPMHAVTGLSDTRFGVVVESIDTVPLAQLVVERAMYWDANGATWAAGTDLLATPVP